MCLVTFANRDISKDAGFVYESLRIETKRVIWDFGLYETNPRNESFKNESTKRIHDTNLWGSDSRIRIRESES